LKTSDREREGDNKEKTSTETKRTVLKNVPSKCLFANKNSVVNLEKESRP